MNKYPLGIKNKWIWMLVNIPFFILAGICTYIFIEKIGVLQAILFLASGVIFYLFCWVIVEYFYQKKKIKK